MNRLLNLFMNLFYKREMKFTTKLWKTENCYKCNNPYDKNNFWTEFTEINGTVFQVPICDKCSGPSIKAKPKN